MIFESRLKEHKNLFFTFIDFKKAYESVNRDKLIEVLIKYRLSPKIVDLIVQMYEKDETLNLGKNEGDNRSDMRNQTRMQHLYTPI